MKAVNVRNKAATTMIIRITQITASNMTISYSLSTVSGKLRTLHTITIEHETLTTTRAKEVLTFAKPRIFSKSVWKELKEAVRLGEPLTVTGGGIFD